MTKSVDEMLTVSNGPLVDLNKEHFFKISVHIFNSNG